MQQVTNTDTVSGSHSSQTHSPHFHSIHSPPQIIEINNQNLPTKKILPLHPMIIRSKAVIFKLKLYQVSNKIQPLLPKNTSDALKDPKWKKVMEDEYYVLMKSENWTLIPNNQNYKLIGNKWVYRVKENSYSTINKYKVRLVTKWVLQTPRLYFNETSSPVVKATTIRIILTLIVNNDWFLRQVDINNAFLNGGLT